ncbi:KCTD21 [Branchiostoma lanceolatum]|uniref:KCTD21 protein n=1 Tax=Branchiostoma lanceolatum TaxID=7740 RepID=A0A8K0A551_BRALA|nr:KCTD21 [Branchiostoma lanceolatum]
MSSEDTPVTLNVGGFIYTTLRSTLTRYPDSALSAMFSPIRTLVTDEHGRCFIDRDGKLFRYVLNFLRTSELLLPKNFDELRQLKKEAEFYSIQPLTEALSQYQFGQFATVHMMMSTSSTAHSACFRFLTSDNATRERVRTALHKAILMYFELPPDHDNVLPEEVYTTPDGLALDVGARAMERKSLNEAHILEALVRAGFTIQGSSHHCCQQNCCEYTWTLVCQSCGMADPIFFTTI